MNKRSPRTYIGIFIGLSISVIALLLVFHWAGFKALKEALTTIRLPFIFLGLVTFLLSMFFRVVAWRILLQQSVSIWRVFTVLNQGYLINNVLPWRLGEFGRAILLGRRPNLTAQGVLASIFVERLYDIVIALGFFAALIPFAVGLPGISRSVFFAVAVIASAAFGLLLLLRYPQIILRVVDILPGGRDRWGRHFDRFREGLQTIRSPRIVGMSLFFLLTSWFLAGFQYWFVLRSMVPEAQIHWAFFMLTITMLGVTIPSSPGYVGVFEAAGVLALSAFNVPEGQALAATLVLHAMVYVVSSAIGAFAFIGEGEALWRILLQVRERFLPQMKRMVE
jgi:glycosyltransferase 2 family protein